MLIPFHHASVPRAVLLGLIAVLGGAGAMPAQDPAADMAPGTLPIDYIDPFIGTGHDGKDFPGASTPFGMVKLSPDTQAGGPVSYSYGSHAVQGFSFTHIGGADGGDLANLTTMATTGPLHTYWSNSRKPGTSYASAIDKASEVASAGYFAVTLSDYGVRAEATAAPHSGILRFTFPAQQLSRIQIDLSRRNDGTSQHQTVTMTDDHTIEGMVVCTPDGGGWRFGPTGYTLYYHLEFSKPIRSPGTWSATLPAIWSNHKARYNKTPGKSIGAPDFIEACRNAAITPGSTHADGQHIGFYSEFPTTAGEIVLVKAGVSFVSIAGARANLAAEIPDWDFDRVHTQARQLWSAAFAHLTVQGGSADHATVFYSALYRALLFPMIFADLDGTYTGGDHLPHAKPGFTNRTLFSGWDEFRSKYPLLTLVAPAVVNDQINSMVSLAETNGTHVYDRWEIMGCYTGIMTGNPEVVVINDAWQKGIRGFDVATAYADAVTTTTKNGNAPLGFRRGSISETTEYGLDEWNLSRMATGLGKTVDAATYMRSAMSYRSLFDPDVPWTYDAEGKDSHPGWKGWFRPKDGSGAFMPWLGLLSTVGGREADVYQAGWSVYYDVPGLVALLGGPELFAAKLTDFYARSPDYSHFPADRSSRKQWWAGYNNPGNEPTELIVFEFNRAGFPWLTQQWITASEYAYATGPEGMTGDDDVGQLSAWYVTAASGLAQSCPGDPRFEIVPPLFSTVTYRFDSAFAHGTSLVITAKDRSPANIYIQSALFNGKPLDRCWLSYAEVTGGGTLDLTMGPTPNRSWGIH
jgi:predicted alpha-1,2-mannosidase